MALEVTSLTMEGAVDLIVAAPIKLGFIDAFETVTFESRLRLAGDAFYQARKVAREYALTSPFSDVAERIQSLTAYRIGIVDTFPKRTFYLSVTFDRSWEEYMRLVWSTLGNFLDVLLCNCEGYVPAGDNTYDQYIRWIREHQVDSVLFDQVLPVTLTDQSYLVKMEQLQRKGGISGDDHALATIVADDPVKLAKEVLDDAVAGATDPREFYTLALEALTALHRLTDLYPPDRPNGEHRYLIRAAHDLLQGWDATAAPSYVREPYKEIFEWYKGYVPPSPVVPADPPTDFTEIQAGIRTSLDDIADRDPIARGYLLMFGVFDATAARQYIARFANAVSWDGDQAPRSIDVGNQSIPGFAFINVGFTYQGLRNLLLSDTVTKNLPKEFREGCESRAPLLGDEQLNHPRRWTPPPRFGFLDENRINLNEVDFILQLRVPGTPQDIDEPIGNTWDALAASKNPLAKVLHELNQTHTVEDAGVRLLAIETLWRDVTSQTGGPLVKREIFGHRDDISQPVPLGRKASAGVQTVTGDQVSLGEVVRGYANDRGDPAPPDDPRTKAANDFMRNGTFQVIRKMSQDVGALDAFLNNPQSNGAPAAMKGDDLLAKMFGRTRDGVALADPTGTPGGSAFDYLKDPDGIQCPLQAHIRRANPRIAQANPYPGKVNPPTPRIVRRSMSYGSRIRDDGQERGAMFMAFNASLAEQYEVIQRWINGGNSTGVSSSQNDPVIGVFPAQGGKTFRFAREADVVRVDIEKPFVALQWGLYLFVPSKKTLESICDFAAIVKQTLGDPNNGEKIIKEISQLTPADQAQAWQIYMQDFTTKEFTQRSDTPDVWAAIRKNYEGVMRMANQVVVANNELEIEVLRDAKRFSVSEQGRRLNQSMGPIFVGDDPGELYNEESQAANYVLSNLNQRDGFSIGINIVSGMFSIIFGSPLVKQLGYAELDLKRDFVDLFLSLYCYEVFGIPDDQASKLPPLYPAPPPPYTLPTPPFFASMTWNWLADPKRTPVCPGDFIAPSRYSFFPDPTPAVTQYGQRHGQGVRAAAKAYIDWRRPPPGPGGAATTPPPPNPPPLGIVGEQLNALIADNDLLARNLSGIMLGGVPTLQGNLENILFDWIENKTLWRVQEALFNRGPVTGTILAQQGAQSLYDWTSKYVLPLVTKAMQKRPVPDLMYRTATEDTTIGGMEVKAGEKVVISVGSAMQERYEQQEWSDVSAVFGGLREGADWPVHACPAYNLAMGTIMGVVVGLLQAGRLEALPGPLRLRVYPA